MTEPAHPTFTPLLPGDQCEHKRGRLYRVAARSLARTAGQEGGTYATPDGDALITDNFDQGDHIVEYSNDDPHQKAYNARYVRPARVFDTPGRFVARPTKPRGPLLLYRVNVTGDWGVTPLGRVPSRADGQQAAVADALAQLNAQLRFTGGEHFLDALQDALTSGDAARGWMTLQLRGEPFGLRYVLQPENPAGSTPGTERSSEQTG